MDRVVVEEVAQVEQHAGPGAVEHVRRVPRDQRRAGVERLVSSAVNPIGWPECVERFK
jgi:pyridoxal biosynthesis lyase PdxS